MLCLSSSATFISNGDLSLASLTWWMHFLNHFLPTIHTFLLQYQPFMTFLLVQCRSLMFRLSALELWSVCTWLELKCVYCIPVYGLWLTNASFARSQLSNPSWSNGQFPFYSVSILPLLLYSVYCSSWFIPPSSLCLIYITNSFLFSVNSLD